MGYIWFVPDPTLSAIDRFFDFVDSGVAAFKHAFHRGEQVEEKHGVVRVKRHAVIDTVARPKPKKAAASVSTALARPPFYIVESITSAGIVFVVTDGGAARTECSTRASAERLLHALVEKP